MVAYTHTQTAVYRKRNDSRHAIDLHAMSWILSLQVLLALAEEVVSGEEQLG